MSWLDSFKARWKQADREDEVKGSIRRHALRVELIARLSTVDLSKIRGTPAEVLADCVQAARLVCKRKEVPIDPDNLVESPDVDSI